MEVVLWLAFCIFLVLSCDDCLEDKREDYQNCSVLYSCKHTHMSSSYRCIRDCWFRFRCL